MTLKRRTAIDIRQTSSDHLRKGGDKTVLIDGDIIRYQAACVCDVVNYACPDGEIIHYKKDAVAHCKEYDLDVADLVKTVTPEPVSFCLHTIKSMIHNIMDKCDASTARIFLTGKGNYREDIDSIAPYKGQRSPDKPTHFEAAGTYLMSRFDAELISGKEADDQLAIEQCESLGALTDEQFSSLAKTVIATTDKDLNTIAGWHYNFQKDDLYWVTEVEADRFFYTQLLTGDSTDNIKGCKGVGAVGAQKLLEGLTEPLSMYNVCLKAYLDAGQDYYDLLENASLLWIQREEGVLWKPPT